MAILSKPKNISPIDQKASIERLQEMKNQRQHLIQTGQVEQEHIRISEGNIKLGNIISLSLIPVIDCGNCKHCSGLCYDLRTDCMRKNVRSSRAVNSAIYYHDPERFFKEWQGAVNYYTQFRGTKACRYNVGGDIPDHFYFWKVIETAEMFPDVDFLIFTKQFHIVNDCIERNNDKLPKNLKVIFSNWVGLPIDNPYNLPTSNPLFSTSTMEKMGYSKCTTAHEGAYFCTGNCTSCKLGCPKSDNTDKWHGCWSLQKGEEVIFYAH